jgi:DNA-binding IclR family transcriptional regulator
MPKPRVHRFLKTLLTLGYVQQDTATERYRLSLKLYHLGQALADHTILLSEARPQMVQLRDATKQTTTLSAVEAAGMRVLDIVRAQSPVEIVTRPGALLDFHASAQGKVALAFGAPDNWRVVRAGPLRKWTAFTNTSVAKLEAEVETVRSAGWAEAPEQTLAGVNALSAPVFDASARLVATITIAGPMAAIPSPPGADQIEAVTRAAMTISSNLGYAERDQ